MRFQVKKYTYGDQPSQFGELWIPRGEGLFPVVVSIHGGFWEKNVSLDIMNPLVEDLTVKGIAIWNVEYRRVGEKGGGWPGTFTDVANATDYLREIAEENNLDLKHLVIVGHSVGGHMGLWLAVRNLLPEDSELRITNQPLDIKVVVSLAGVCDLALMETTHRLRSESACETESYNPVHDLLEGTPLEVPSRYADVSLIQLISVKSKQILIHGNCDLNVPIGISQNYYHVALNAGVDVELIEIKNAEHFKVIDPKSDCWSIIAKAVMKAIEI